MLATQSCLTLCYPMNCSPPGSSVHGILQARILEWVAISFAMGSSQTRDWTWVSRIAGRFFTIWATREAQTAQATRQLKPVSTGLPFQNVCIVGTIQYVTFSYCLFSLDNMHLSFLHGLIVSHFFLVMNNILLSGCTTFYLFIHLLKDILVDTEFW